MKAIEEKNFLKYYILTMGCKLNENDSEKICGMAEELGYIRTEEIKKADLYIINTCCIRENAEEKVFGKLRRNKKIQTRKWKHNCCWWLYDARATHNRKIKQKLPIYRHNIWNTHTPQTKRPHKNP